MMPMTFVLFIEFFLAVEKSLDDISLPDNNGKRQLLKPGRESNLHAVMVDIPLHALLWQV